MTAATMKERLAAAETVSIWPLPDMTVLNAGRRDPVPMPADLFGPAWPLLSAIAEGTASPVDYAAIGFVAAAASLIGGKRRVRPYESSAWSEPCILWCGAVGDPSTRKSPSLDAVTEPLRLIERDHAELHREKLREWQNHSAVAKAAREDWQGQIKKAVKEGKSAPMMPPAAIEPDEPSRRRTIVVDATPEAVGAILAGNPQGTMHFRDELAGWLMSFDRYSPGGREFWLEAYGGRPFVIDRKGAKEPVTIPFNGVTVLGGIQPAKLAGALLDSPDDGLTARFLWAWPDKVAFRRPQRLADMAALENAYRRLDSLGWAQDAEGRQTALTIPLSAPAADVFERWQADNAAIDDDSGSLFKSFVGKMDGTVLRLALIAELARWAFEASEEPRHISLDSLIAAAGFVDDYAKPMAQRVYGDAALPAAERNAAVLARYIRKHGFTTINKRDLKRSPHKSHLAALRNAAAMDAAVAHLVDSGWLLSVDDASPQGRPRGDYLVNPAIHGGGK
jgi:putative DNA primase/helicase